MFYGIEVKSSGSKSVLLESSLKLTQAVLEPSKNGKREPVTVILETGDKQQFILCVLDPSLSWQCPLDLMFCAASELKFSIRGTGTVHLTGYEVIDDLDDLSMTSEEEEEEEERRFTVEAQNGTKKSKSKSAKDEAVTRSKTNGRIPIKRNIPPEEMAALEDEDDSDDDEFNLSSLDSNDDDEDLDEDEELLDGSIDDESLEDGDDADDDDDDDEDNDDEDDDDDDDDEVMDDDDDDE